jgi:hypothetical protein
MLVAGLEMVEDKEPACGLVGGAVKWVLAVNVALVSLPSGAVPAPDLTKAFSPPGPTGDSRSN